MDSIKLYLQNFLNRSGGIVFIATVIARLFSFLASFIALKLVPSKPLGTIIFSWNTISFLLPFIGLGLHQGYLRYGALATKNDKESLFNYIFKKGSILSIAINLLLIIIVSFISFEFENTSFYISLLSFSFTPLFLIEILKTQARLHQNNKRFAFIEIVYNSILVVLVFSLSYLYTEIGYALALVLSPAITAICYSKPFKKGIVKIEKPQIITPQFWKFGIHASLAHVATVLLLAIDIFLIGNLTKNPENVTIYRYLSLLPFSILFLPRVFITTDFVSFTEQIKNSNYIKNYCKNYISLFSFISVFLLVFITIFSDVILGILGKNYLQYKSSFYILNIGVCGILILRGLFGNLLSSIGKANMNYYLNLTALLLNIISNYYLIPKYGIKGAAITSASIMWFTGTGSYILFKHYYSKKEFH